MSIVDWDIYRKCPVCGSEIGRPCMSLLAVGEGLQEEKRDRPHFKRKLRTGYGR